MKPLKLKHIFFYIFSLILTSSFCYSQEGNITINQDKNIANLLELKKEMNKSETDPDKYKIQIYSGNRTSAESAKTKFSNAFSEWRPSIQYETPNFKIWAGNFITRLEADRALKRIKKKFPNAFIFKPKKEKK